jgi:hypothetical protein
MPINFGVVAASGNIVAHDKPLPPTTKQTITKLVENLPKHDSKVSYAISGDTYHCLVENGILYICISDEACAARTAYGMLAETKEEFKTQFGNGPGRYPKPVDVSIARCSKFGVTIAAKIRYFNENPHGDKIGKLKNQIEDVKQVMLNNIDEIMERGQRIDNLVDKSEFLVEQAEQFEDNSRTLKNVMIWRHLKIVLMVLLVLGILGWILSMVVCKPNYSKCKSADEPAANVTTTAVAPVTTTSSAVVTTTTTEVTTTTTTVAPTTTTTATTTDPTTSTTVTTTATPTTTVSTTVTTSTLTTPT